MGERLHRLRLENFAAQQFDLFLARAGIDAIARGGGKVDLRPRLTDRGGTVRDWSAARLHRRGSRAAHVTPARARGDR